MKPGIAKPGIASLIVLAMLVMAPGAAAYAVDVVGTIQYEDGTTCPYGWLVLMENLNETYIAEPWDDDSHSFIFWDYKVTGETESDDHYVTVNVTSPDGMWFDERACVRLGDVYNTTTDNYDINLVVEDRAYIISGYTNPAADTVKITNLDKPGVVDDRPADYIGTDGFYNLTLAPAEVEAGDELQIIACEDLGDYESNCNVTFHTVVNAPGEDVNVNLTLDHYCKNYYPSYPFHTWEEDDWSGPAAMEMMIDHYRDASDVPSQTELNETGIGYNQDPCNADLSYVDPKGMRDTLNLYLHAYGELPYVSNYGVGSYDTLADTLHYMCKWHYLGPGAAPAYGDYSNWMAVRGIHTDVKPSFAQGTYSIYGFWINDPNPNGIGENTYKTVDQWSNTYHLSLTGVRDGDDYEDKYVAVCEPPEPDNVTVTIADSPARFSAEAAQVVQASRAMQAESQVVTGVGVKGVKGTIADMETMAEVGDVVEEANRYIVQAAIDGAEEQLVPYDPEFAAIFEDVVADNPLLVENGNNDYYLVPFAESYKDSVEEVDAMIADLEAMKNAVPAAHEAAIQASIDELESLRSDLNLDRGEIMVVIIVDADDGHFEEASWVTTPVEYLPTTEAEALGIVGEAGATAELVYLGGLGYPCSPYYPDWKITDGCSVYYVNQQGELYDADADCDGYLISEGDCDDNNAAANPGATEVCDGVDNDCDGDVDEGCPTDPSVIDHDSDAKYFEWCVGWGDVDNALVRDGACAAAITPGEAYITLDMGETRNSGTVTVRCGSCFREGANFDGTTTVYGSADNSNWVTLGTFVIPEDSALTDYTVSFSDQQVRYVKVHLLITECETEWSVDGITW